LYSLGGIEEIELYLHDDQVQYILAQVGSKDVFISWTGPEVSKTKSSKKKGDVSKVMAVLGGSSTPHVDLVNREHFTEENVMKNSSPGASNHVID